MANLQTIKNTGHRTLWRPTSKNSAFLKQARPLASRSRAGVMKQESTTKLSYWHHFDDDDEAWPKVVLLVSSTERTTTPRKTIKKTFASYFPHLNRKYTTTENTKSEDQKHDEESDAVAETSKIKELATNWVPNNSERIGDNIVLLEEEDDKGTDEAENNIEFKRRAYILTTRTKNSSNIERRNGVGKTETTMKLTTTTTKTDPITKTDPTTVTDPTTETDPKTETDPTTKKDPTTKTDPTTKKLLLNKNSKKKSEVRCYQCGLNSPEIPYEPTCSQIFASDARKYVFMRKQYKVSCAKAFKGGCTRRFLDIGATYDERGCRTMPPIQGKSFASHRMAVLEKTIHGLREGCVTSPHASLTPFSRAISLFARYHVCVCVGQYCNHGNVLHKNSLTFIICLFSTILALASTLTGFS